MVINNSNLHLDRIFCGKSDRYEIAASKRELKRVKEQVVKKKKISSERECVGVRVCACVNKVK